MEYLLGLAVVLILGKLGKAKAVNTKPPAGGNPPEEPPEPVLHSATMYLAQVELGIVTIYGDKVPVTLGVSKIMQFMYGIGSYLGFSGPVLVNSDGTYDIHGDCWRFLKKSKVSFQGTIEPGEDIILMQNEVSAGEAGGVKLGFIQSLHLAAT